MATEVVKVVDPGGGGDYTTLEAWNIGERRDLVAADEIAVCEIKGTVLANYLDLSSGWTTDDTRFVIFRAAPGWEYTLTKELAGGNIATVDNTTQYKFVFRTQIARVNLYNLYFKSQHNSNTEIFFWLHSNYNLEMENCKVELLSGSSRVGATNRVTYRNCYFHNCRYYSAYRTTLINCGAYSQDGVAFGGFSGDMLFRDCITYNCYALNEEVTTSYHTYYSPDGGDYNAVGSTRTNPVVPGSNSLQNLTLADFVDLPNGDYNLSQNSILKGAGSNTVPHTTTDINGLTRTVFDIGPVESAAPEEWHLPLGGTDVTRVYLGSTELSQIYLGVDKLKY